MQFQCCLAFLFTFEILASSQLPPLRPLRPLRPPPPPPTHSQSGRSPSTCVDIENVCSDDQGCIELLNNFKQTCQRRVEQGSCHQSCVDALSALVSHTKGAAFATCNCGEDSSCNELQKYLKQEYHLEYGTPKQHCREAIATCLLDSCCRKAYMEFYNGEECKPVITFPGIGPNPNCSDACVAKFDKLAESPFAEGLFSCSCSDWGLACNKLYTNYKKFCTDNTVSISNEEQREQRSDDSVDSTTSNCLLQPKCRTAFLSFMKDCKTVAFYLHDGPCPLCTTKCVAKANELLQQLGTEKSKLRENLEHCFHPKTYDCPTATSQCVQDPTCLALLASYVYGDECKNVLEYDGHSSPEPNCSTACIELERELRKHPKAQALLYCECPAVSRHNCSKRRDNFNRFCNVCPDNYSLPTTSSRRPSCSEVEKACHADQECNTLLAEFAASCSEVLLFTEETGSESHPVCGLPCVLAQGNLVAHSVGKKFEKCHCAGAPHCLGRQTNIRRFCAVPGNPSYPTGTDANSTCEVILHNCLRDPGCRSGLNSVVKEGACHQISPSNPNVQEGCKKCLEQMEGLARLGTDLTTCTCAMHPCKLRRQTITAACIPPGN